MSKRVIKKWVMNLLIIINSLNIALISGEWSSLKMQILYTVLSFGFMILSLKLIDDRMEVCENLREVD